MPLNLSDSDRHYKLQTCHSYDERLKIFPGPRLISHGYLVRKSLCGDQRYLGHYKVTGLPGLIWSLASVLICARRLHA